MKALLSILLLASLLWAAPARAQTATTVTSGAALGISSITWSWTPLTSGATGYRVMSSSTGVNLSGDLSAATSAFAFTGLQTNTTYGIMVEAFGVGFALDSATSTVSTFADRPTGLALGGLSGPTLTNDSVAEQLSWNANTNPAGTLYNVLWWTNLTSTVTVSTGTNSAVAGGLVAGGTNFFTVQAVNLDGIATQFDPSFYTLAPSTFFPVASQLLPFGFAGSLTFDVPDVTGAGAGVVTVQIASGTFASAVTLTVSTPAASGFPAVGSGLADLPSPIHLTITAIDGSNNPQQPLRPILITITYSAANFASSPTALEIARFDAIRGLWIPLATSRNGSTLTAVTDHLTSFAVLTFAAAQGLSAITVGPNPLRPVLQPGVPMTFRNLPAGARLRIFTYVGEKLVDVDADGSGVFGWDGRNRGGGNVASGVYIVVIEGGGQKRTLRVAIER
ncbi:MAG TPA: hypothetical protein VN915_01305 [Elusimicrobiota bacterium]|nr:hypothetical protein [Elusimicrobiota bacterium]